MKKEKTAKNFNKINQYELINKEYKEKSLDSHDRIYQNIMLIKSLIKQGSNLIKKNLD